MKKVLITILALCVLVSPALAKGPTKQAGKSNKGHLYLYEKDPSDWEMVEKGAWGKMTYDLSGEKFDFVFNGHKLESETDYTLIYYPDPWPGEGLMCLGEAATDEYGDVHIENSKETGDLPAIYDHNNELNKNHADCLYGVDDGTCIDGAKIWLVSSEDVNCETARMIGWDPHNYLFEEKGINFEYTDWQELRLENKDISNWEIIDDDSIYGILNYTEGTANDTYTFYGYGLDDGNYSLISYKEGPGAGSYLLGVGESVDGELKISGMVSTYILNDYPSGEYAGFRGAKIWLLPSTRLSVNASDYVQSISWWPYMSEFLWETDLIFKEPL